MGEQRMTISLNGSDLTVTQVVAVARHGEPVALAPEAIAAMRRSRAAQAIDLRALSVPNGPGQLGLGTGRAYRMIRELVPFTEADGTLPADLEPLVELVTRGTLTPAA